MTDTENSPDRQTQPAPGTRPFRFGEGRISGYLSALFGISALLGVLAFIFPEWLTTKDLRESLYTFRFARNLLWSGIVIAFTMGIVSYILSPQKKLAATGVITAFLAVLLGAFNVQERAVQEVPFSFGIDWFVLSLIFSMAIFIPLEKAFARHPLNVLRPEWRTDLTYFCVSHLLIQFFLLFTNVVQNDLFGWAHSAAVTEFAQGLPIWAQFIACVFIADLFQSVTHRWYHQNPWSWKFHSIHHSSKNMDWLAGSRTHFIEALATRSAVIVPLYIINFSEPALNAYVVLVGVQAVFVHANVRWDFGFLKYVLVTPQYHHWHHSDDPAYANTNFAVHLPLIDMLMGTFKLPDKMWPDTYGVFGQEPPQGFVPQLAYPFIASSGDSNDAGTR